jgi:3-methyladenine DNA glycosylase Tag
MTAYDTDEAFLGPRRELGEIMRHLVDVADRLSASLKTAAEKMEHETWFYDCEEAKGMVADQISSGDRASLVAFLMGLQMGEAL